jgi:4-diphosphocytidyl-2-C-methyl-D-erythritol kinase
MITEKAFAKINLSLDILGLRPDRYHEVSMVMQTIDLCDTLTFEKEGSGITLVTDNEILNTEQDSGKDNLIVKAVKAIFDSCGSKENVKITLTKNIPIAAGMAGGSADAAAALRGINKLFNLSFSDERLKEIAVKIGADVPFCVSGGCALSEGIGEKLTPVRRKLDYFVVTCKPDIFVSTKDVYVAFDDQDADSIKHPGVHDQVAALERGDEEEFLKNMGNVLEPVTKKMHPVIGDIETFFTENNATATMMSGSGPTVFALFKEKETAEAVFSKAKEKYKDYSVNLATFI